MSESVVDATTGDSPSRWRGRLASAHPAWAAGIAHLASRPVDRVAVDATIDAERGPAWRDEKHLREGLRHARNRVLAALVDRDLDGRADLAEVMTGMTALAEAAIAEALRFHASAAALVHGVPRRGRGDDPCGEAQDLVVVGMGKLGGCELNASSDIDLIFVYDEDGETRGEARAETRDEARDETRDETRAETRGETRGEPAAAVRSIANAEFFARVGRRLIATLSEVTADGFVFRVDMRLRPDGDAGPLVASLSMLERYLVTSARDWERFAWVKARVVSPAVFGRGQAADALMRLVVPFVYRRYLDFGAIDALRRLHGQIRDEAARREAARQGRSARSPVTTRIDVKLGRGGIREIEFVVQHFQLIRGGREPVLRARPTVAMLAILVDEGLMPAAIGRRLHAAYVFLRNVEHRLQYLDDAQTHVLPPRDALDDCERLTTMCARLVDADAPAGFDGVVATLERHRECVSSQFEEVFGLEPVEAPAPASGPMRSTDVWDAFSEADPLQARDATMAAAIRARLAAMGFVPAEDAAARLTALARSPRLRSMSSTARGRMDALVPRLLDASSLQPQPMATLARWFDLIEAIAGRSAYLALLNEFPDALRAVTRLLAASPWAAQYLSRHPVLLDELIAAPAEARPRRDASQWEAHWRDVAEALVDRLTHAASDAERQMDVLREAHHVETFRLLVDDLEGRLPIETLSDQLSALADLTLEATVASCWSHFVAERGDADAPTLPVFAVIGYGKLGGKELGYVSDLDLVFLFDHRAESGDPSIAVQRYARFAQRLNVWLTARTTAGALFDIDLRLRPDGAAGLVVSSFDAWSKYQRRTHDVGAWTWEHQALTRARFCAGDRALGEAFETERRAILGSRPADAADRSRLRDDIVAMRKRMHDGHPNRSGLFDLKHDTGGMVDIEFAVQYLVLAWGPVHRDLLDDVGNIALLARAAAHGLIPAETASTTADAYRVYRAAQHASRLADPAARAARIAADALVAERACVQRLWERLFG